eukprot:2764495-Alexandrium_andersonii.AAC.1
MCKRFKSSPEAAFASFASARGATFVAVLSVAGDQGSTCPQLRTLGSLRVIAATEWVRPGLRCDFGKRPFAAQLLLRVA